MDFEFNRTSERFVNLVSCTVKKGTPKTYWLHFSPSGKRDLKEELGRNTDAYFLAWAAEAECRSINSLFKHPRACLDYKWIDLFLEYRCLQNHDHALSYGKQLIDGKERTTRPPLPKWKRTEEDNKAGASSKPQQSLAAGTFKILGKTIDTAHKTKMRDLIISDPAAFGIKDREDILAYNASDVELLHEIFDWIWAEWKRRMPKWSDERILAGMLVRGEFAARTAAMVTIGYPINLEATKNFSAAAPQILFEMQRDINNLFPDIKPFQFDKREFKFKWKKKETGEWIKRNHKKGILDAWQKTAGGDLSLALDAWTRFYDFRHEYPKDNFGAQMVRYLKTKQQISGFIPRTGDRTFWDAVGSDGRVRSYFNIYGAQSSRNQPSSTSFIFLKAAWMRVMVEPAPGKCIIGVDWSSQEFLISAICSSDPNMIRAYESGDVYLFFAKLAKAVPMDGKRENYEKERDLFKATTLGISYLMTKFGLSIKLTNDTGVEHTEEDAQDLIDKFDDAFPIFSDFRETLVGDYAHDGHMVLLDDWVMWGDNDNFRSVANCLIQAAGAAIMRKAVAFAQDAGLDILFPNHDAIYAEIDHGDWEKADILMDCMDRAFRHFFTGKRKEKATCRMDAHAWGPGFQADGKIKTPANRSVKISRLYLDKRGEAEYKRFGSYLKDQDHSDL